ncbi:MAG: HAD family hydrolase [Planctomycetota bacterium]
MPLVLNNVKAIVFDLGNTLIEFGPRQIKYHNAAMEQTFLRMFGTCDLERLTAIRDKQITAPDENHFKENDLRTISIELVQGLYNITPSEEQINILLNARYNTFLDVVELPDNILTLLKNLSQHYRIALISNYPCGKSIRDALGKIGLLDKFEAIVVSGEVGYVKPHPYPFEAMLNLLKLNARQCIYVGDNWLADIQGAKRIEMQAIYTTQYAPYGKITPSDGDYQPDARISHIEELKRLLMRDG